MMINSFKFQNKTDSLLKLLVLPLIYSILFSDEVIHALRYFVVYLILLYYL
jgi:hypothetical protein